MTDIDLRAIGNFNALVLASAAVQMMKVSSENLSFDDAIAQAKERLQHLRPEALDRLDARIRELELEIEALETAGTDAGRPKR